MSFYNRLHWYIRFSHGKGFDARLTQPRLNPLPAKLVYLNFRPLEVVSRYRDSQLQVAENHSYLLNLSTNICKS